MQRIALLRPSNLNTRRADENAILDFMRFAGIVRRDRPEIWGITTIGIGPVG
jgi:hypothetical protein